jgi:hypothetical protein
MMDSRNDVLDTITEMLGTLHLARILVQAGPRDAQWKHNTTLIDYAIACGSSTARRLRIAGTYGQR